MAGSLIVRHGLQRASPVITTRLSLFRAAHGAAHDKVSTDALAVLMQRTLVTLAICGVELREADSNRPAPRRSEGTFARGRSTLHISASPEGFALQSVPRTSVRGDF